MSADIKGLRECEMETGGSIVVEENGENGFDFYRVPGIVGLSNGDLMVTYEGRGEENRRALFIRRYQEKEGRLCPTGGRIAMVTSQEGELLHNPLLIAAPEGRLYFFWCQDYQRLFLRESEDNGISFGEIRELTSAIDDFRKSWPVTLWSIAPGHGIHMKNGTLVLPLWLSRGENAHLPAVFACLYSKDRGITWQGSNIVAAGNGVGDPTEASVAERTDGTLLATLRHERRGVRRRAFCESNKDLQWGEAWLQQELPDPICGGALASLPGGKMAFVNCAYGDEPALERQRRGEDIRWSTDARQRLTLRLSENEGKTWTTGILLAKEGGASDLAFSSGYLYCFYEEGWKEKNCIFNQRLRLVGLSLECLTKKDS